MKAKLLLVEDSATQGSQTKLELEQLGYDVRWVKSGVEALKWARQDPPDLIVLDVVMEDIRRVCRLSLVEVAPRHARHPDYHVNDSRRNR